MNKQTNMVLGAIVIIIIIVAIIFGKHSTPAPVDTGTQTSTETTQGTENAALPNGAAKLVPDKNIYPVKDNPNMTGTAPVAPNVKTFTVTGSNYAFAPKTITVNKGDTVKIIFTNSGGLHDFVIDEFNVATQKVNSGESAVVQFVADKTGTFQYYCSVGNHRAMGMWGTLTVK